MMGKKFWKEEMDRKKAARIIVPLIIIVLIGMMWFIKNREPAAATAPIPAKVAQKVESPTPAATDTPVSETQEEVPTTPEVAEVEEPARIPMEYTVYDQQEFFSHNLPLLLDFGAAACGPCQTMKPDLTAFYEETYGKVTVRYADVWEDASRTGGLPAMVVPTQFLFYADGSPYQPSEEVAQKIYFYQYVYRDSGELALTSHQGILTKEQMYMIFEDMGAL